MNGNTISIKKKDGSKETILTWSSENLLTAVSYKESGSLVKTISYRYDGLNRRIEKNLNDLVNPNKSQVHRYFYDGNNIVLEADGNGKILAYYMHTLELDHPVAMLRDLDGNNSFSSNEVFTFTRDHLGSIRELVNSQQKAIQRYHYSTYGKTTLEKADSSTDHQFVENLFAYTGREYDQDTEFYGYRNRYYSPGLGRFISMDPIGLNGGDVNLYRYVENRPISFKDPLGLDTCGFSQSSGTFVCMDESGNLSAVDKGYSGKGGGKNNPNMQNIKDTGPLPKGTYSIGPGEYRERTGDFSRRLTPNRMTRKNFPNGRDPYSFLLHGDSRRDPGNASNGCPILSRKARSTPPTGSILNVVE